MRFAVGRPFAHAVRVCLRKAFYGFGGAAVRVPFTQNRVNRRSLDRVILGTDSFLFVTYRRFRVIGECETLRLKLFDCGNQLGHRCGDIGQLDHICLRRLHQASQFSQIITLTLIFA